MINELTFKKAKNGDSESFYQLISPVQSKLYKIAFTYMKNEEDSLDIIQDSIINAIKSIDKLKEPQSFNFWITKIVINNCKTALKKQNKKIVNIDDFSETLGSEQEIFEDNSDLYKALNKLKEKDKEILLMRYIEDMKLTEISKEKNISLGTVKSIVSRSLKKLRISLGEVKNYE